MKTMGFAGRCSCGLRAAAAAALVAWAVPAGAQFGGPAPEPMFVETPGALEFSGQLIARPKQAADWAADGLAPALAAQQRADALALLAPDQVAHAPGPDRFVIDIPAGEDENSYAAALMATGLFEYVHPNWICTLQQVVPNDPNYPNQWQHQAIETGLAWTLETGEPNLICAFVDSGVDTDHPDLADVLVPGFNSADGIPQSAGGQVEDVNGHGTAVGGCIGAIGNNSVGVAGVCWDIKLMPIRASNLPSGNASLNAILTGAEWAIENGARVASASYTGVQSPAVGSSGAYIKSIGGLFCYAADNSNTNHAGWDHPDVVVVGATDINDNKANFSSYGLGVDVFAPGVGVWTTKNGGGFGGSTGTSFATPITNGVLGLIWSAEPTLTPDEAQAILYQTCDDLGEPGEDDFFGWGRVNAFTGVLAASAVNGGPVAPNAVDDQAATVEGEEVVVLAFSNDFDLNLDDFELDAFETTSTEGGDVAYVPPFLGDESFVYTPPTGFSGFDTFSYTIEDEGGLVSDPAVVTIEVFDLDAFRDPDDLLEPAPGVETSYYNLAGSNPSQLPDFDALEPFAAEILPNINYASTNGDFIGSGLSDDVGAVFTGFVKAGATEEFTFYTNSDDGSKLYIGDELVVDNDGLHPMQERSGVIRLKKGMHQIRVEFFERGGGAGLIVSFASWSQPKQVIPASAWQIDIGTPCGPDLDNDGDVDSADLNQLLAAFGSDDPAGDVNDDGVVDSSDLNDLLAVFGAGC